MSQKPKIAIIFFPGNIGSISPPLLIFSAMIWAPASPNPNASNAPVFMINFSRKEVSYFSYSFLAAISSVCPDFSKESIAKASYSSIWAALKGLAAIL